MPSLTSLPLTAGGPVSSLSTPILIGSFDVWARAVGATRTRARTTTLTRAIHFFRSMLWPPPMSSRRSRCRPRRRPAYGAGESRVNRPGLWAALRKDPYAGDEDPIRCRQTASFWHRSVETPCTSRSTDSDRVNQWVAKVFRYKDWEPDRVRSLACPLLTASGPSI